MIQLSARSEILIAISPQDFRKGIDGFVSLCHHEFGHNPKSGIIFVFINRSKTMIRLLSYESNGYWLMTKRLSKGKFTRWPKNEQSITPLMAWELRKLLCNMRA
jgi:transposase